MKDNYKTQRKCSIGSVPDETALYIKRLKESKELKSEGDAVKFLVDFYIKNNV